ncbi:MAG: DUF3577 domain-containing protein [Pseudomonadota bacterium]|jgi:hypothetical protein
MDKYFDLHISGLGYLSRAREVKPKRSTPFLAVDVTAIHGHADDVQRVRFDAKVTGAEAQKVIRDLMDDINDRDRKVLAAFKLGDLYLDQFTYETGEKAGQTGISLKTRLLRLAWVKVDGEFVYRAPLDAAPAVPDQAEAA